MTPPAWREIFGDQIHGADERKCAACSLEESSHVRRGHVAGAKQQRANTDQRRADGNDSLRTETIDRRSATRLNGE
jgi:hypothetical protein